MSDLGRGDDSEAPAPRIPGLVVKICGVTTPNDAAACQAAGADLLGVNFWPSSPRCVSPERVGAEIRNAVGIPMVGLFVDPTLDEIERALEASGVGIVQLHGAAAPEIPRSWRVEVIRAAPVRSPADVAQAETAAAGAGTLLVDSAAVGGSGTPIDASLLDALAGLARRRRLLLAGGLRPDTVGAAVRRVRPWGVDVASGVESAPGRKDPAKVRAFVAAAREAAAA